MAMGNDNICMTITLSHTYPPYLVWRCIHNLLLFVLNDLAIVQIN